MATAFQINAFQFYPLGFQIEVDVSLTMAAIETNGDAAEFYVAATPGASGTVDARAVVSIEEVPGTLNSPVSTRES